jgi:hypothetical protein
MGAEHAARWRVCDPSAPASSSTAAAASPAAAGNQREHLAEHEPGDTSSQ